MSIKTICTGIGALALLGGLAASGTAATARHQRLLLEPALARRLANFGSEHFTSVHIFAQGAPAHAIRKAPSARAVSMIMARNGRMRSKTGHDQIMVDARYASMLSCTITGHNRRPS